MESVKKKYGLWTGIAMVVGIVIGSGVFLKAGDVLNYAGGNLWISLLAWLIGGLIMITCGFCFAVFSTKVNKFNGVIDYVEMSTNKKFAYHLSWMMTFLYYPVIASSIAFFASAYFVDLLGLTKYFIGSTTTFSGSIDGLLGCWQVYLIALGFLTIFSLLNYFAPKIAGKFQVSATIIKIFPILVIAIAGLFASLFIKDGGIAAAFSSIGKGYDASSGSYVDLSVRFGDAIRTTAFAYEGWVCATIINAELKDSEKNLPKALVGGTIAIAAFYIIYYIGISATVGNTQNLPGGPNTVVILAGANAPLIAFNNIFGIVGEKLFIIFIIISCLGTLNGLTLSASRGMYTIAYRGQGIFPEKISKLSPKTNMSFYSCLFGYLLSVFMLFVRLLANLEIPFFRYLKNMDTIVCALLYSAFIIMFIYMMKNFKDLNPFKRFIMPTLAIIGSVLFVLVGSGVFQLVTGLIEGKENPYQSLIEFLMWLVLFVVFMIPSFFFYRKETNPKDNLDEKEENK